MKNLITFESFLNEKKASHYMAELVEILSDPDKMEMKPEDFAKYCESEFGLDADVALDILDMYWTLGAKDRYNFNDNQWIKFLNKMGVK